MSREDTTSRLTRLLYQQCLITTEKKWLDEQKILTQKKVEKNKQKRIAKKEYDKEKNRRSPASKKMRAAVEDVMRRYGIDCVVYHGGDLT